MNMIYDSENFVVVHYNDVIDGFEVVDKVRNMEIFVQGVMAEVFRRRIRDWQVMVPPQEEVEVFLDSLCFFAQTPLVLH